MRTASYAAQKRERVKLCATSGRRPAHHITWTVARLPLLTSNRSVRASREGGGGAAEVEGWEPIEPE